MKNTLGKAAIRLLGICWLLVTFAALASMYHLWWQRERVLYVGKNIQQQRKVVFQRTGLPPSLVDAVDSLVRQWPADIRYQARGDATSLSYIKYLLLPRIPAKNTAYTLNVQGKQVTATGHRADQQALDAPPVTINNPIGLILSCAVLLGWAALFRKMWRKHTSWPESLALACLVFTLLVLPTRFFFLTAKPAFAGAIVLALVGWAYLISNCLLHAFLAKKDSFWDNGERRTVCCLSTGNGHSAGCFLELHHGGSCCS